MSNPYTSQSVTGFNASPPPDDGTKTAANQVTWASIKGKLAEPLRVAIEAVNAQVLAAFNLTLGNDITTISIDYTVTVNDQGAFLPVQGATTITLPPVATAGSNFPIAVLNIGTEAVRVDADGSELINGVASIYLGPGESALLTCNATAWSGLISRIFPNRQQAKSGTYLATLADNGSWLSFTSTSTLQLPPVATVGKDFRLGILNAGTELLTVDPDAAETVNGIATLHLGQGTSGILATDGSTWTLMINGLNAITKFKTANESVSLSTAFQDDDHLAGYVLLPNSTYEVDSFMKATSDANADFVMRLTFSNAPQNVGLVATSYDTSGAVFADYYDDDGESFFISGSNFQSIRVSGTFKTNATTGGTATLQWAQGNSYSIASSLLSGSWLRIRRIA